MPSPVISIAQMRHWEQATWAAGQTEAEVIRRVGKCVARCALRLTKPWDPVLILAGKGNNGQDARLAREHLVERRVEVLDVTSPAADLSKLETLLSLKPALIVDGLFGIGLNRPLSPEWVAFIQRINDAKAQVLAVDVPSGLNADTGLPEGAAVQAAVTLTVGAPKLGLLLQTAWNYVGRLEVANVVGLIPCAEQSEVQWTLPEDFAGFPPPRAVATHKGSYGHLAIIAGSLGYHGAAVLAARGAQRAQPGLITLHPQENIYQSVASQLQAVMVSPWAERVSSTAGAPPPFNPAADRNVRAPVLPGNWTGYLFGPGLAAADVPDRLKALLRELWRSSPQPVVVDASALAWLPTEVPPPNAVRLITPHPGEAARLLDSTSHEVQANRVDSLRALSRRFGHCWVVLKGHETLVGRGSGEVFVNSSGNPRLAQGGSGDALSGYVAGLLAQPILQADPLKTIRYAVWQHGAAADFLQARQANWVVEELVATLGSQSPT